MTSHKDEEQKTNIVSPEFSGAANLNQYEEERSMALSEELSLISLPFTNHRLHTNHIISNADIVSLLAPILEEHGLGLGEYGSSYTSFKVGEKVISVSTEDYIVDTDFEEQMRFIEKDVDIRKTVFISNHSSIKGTEVLLAFLKAFQRKYSQSYFEEFERVYIDEGEIQELSIDVDVMNDPDLFSVLETEDVAAYLGGPKNVG